MSSSAPQQPSIPGARGPSTGQSGGSGGSGDNSANLFSSEHGLWVYIQNLEEKLKAQDERMRAQDDQLRQQTEQLRHQADELRQQGEKIAVLENAKNGHESQILHLFRDVSALRHQAASPPPQAGQPDAPSQA